MSNGRLKSNQASGQRGWNVGSRKWFEWLSNGSVASFRFETETNSYTARKEQRESGDYWYAYKKIEGRLRSTYIGRTDELTLEKLEQAVQKLYASPAKQKVTQNKYVTPQNSEKYAILVGIIEKWLNESEGKTPSKDRTWSYALKILAELREVIKNE